MFYVTHKTNKLINFTYGTLSSMLLGMAKLTMNDKARIRTWAETLDGKTDSTYVCRKYIIEYRSLPY